MALITSRTVSGRCPVCGGPHAACGTPADSAPVDKNMEVAVMGGPLRRYTVTVQGVETVMKLNEADAERLGGVPVGEETPEVAAKPAAKKRTAPANKARTAANKGGGVGGGDD